MLAQDAEVFVYVVDRDFGFAPNPFHGFCTLATCKPKIRSAARVGDYVVGMGGSRLKLTGKCIFAMQVAEKLSFNKYNSDERFQSKKPVRNGSRTMLVGDNIYFKASVGWSQRDSHHSNLDGTPNLANLERDTSADYVLIGSPFYYFGSEAKEIPESLLVKAGYKNVRSHRRFRNGEFHPIINWLNATTGPGIHGDPCDFSHAQKRFDTESNTVR